MRPALSDRSTSPMGEQGERVPQRAAPLRQQGSPLEAAVLSQIDGRRSVTTIAGAVGLSAVEVAHVLADLAVRGAVRWTEVVELGSDELVEERDSRNPHPSSRPTVPNVDDPFSRPTRPHDPSRDGPR